jgi:thiamine-phosphate pyrophosphorylase
MRQEMTPAAGRALDDARQQAQLDGAAEVQPWHLLVGLLREEEGAAALRAVAAGLDRESFAALVRSRSAGSSEILSLSAPPLSTAISEALRIAHSLALELHEDSTSGEHLLLALLRASPNTARELHGIGLDLVHLENALLGQRPAIPVLDHPLDLLDLTERVETARILDASANRAREGLRVVEDYCRFVLDDAFLSGEVKALRHDLVTALTEIPAAELLPARETLRDVGTTISTEAESKRGSLREVVRVNLKRLQEALRSLEEYGKLLAPQLGEAIERVRYRSYTLERALLLGTSTRDALRDTSLYLLLSGAGCRASLEWTIAEAAAGGATIFQLREKGLSDRELIERARDVRRWTRREGVLFIVNDRPDIARLVEADGVHLGQDDLPVHEARRIVGADAIIGVSTHDIGQLRRAILDGASYVGVGPVFPSGTKAFPGFVGPELVKQAVTETSLPLFAIGGISAVNIGAVTAAGARAVAVSQAVCASEDPRAAASALVAAFR